MSNPLPVLGVLALITARACATPPATELFAGPNLVGWEFIATPAVALADVCRVQPDGVIALAGKPTGYLTTTASYENYRLHAEWRWPGEPGNSGVLVHISSGPKDRAWPLCFQIQTKNKNAGDLLPMAGAEFAEKLSIPPRAKPALLSHSAPDSEKPAGEWNTCEITCRGDTIEVEINGVRQNRVTGCTPQSGKIGFQFEGISFELRRVQMVRLD
jgi:hypothetical protein